MIILDVTTQAKTSTMVGGSLAGMTGIWNIGRVGHICIRNQSFFHDAMHHGNKLSNHFHVELIGSSRKFVG